MKKSVRKKNDRVIFGLLIALLVLSAIVVFIKFPSSALVSYNLQLFVVLAILGIGILLGLLFLSNTNTSHFKGSKTIKRKKSRRKR